MDLIVTGRMGATSGVATLGAQTFACALGRAGITRNKREGDGATPAGRFPFRFVLYRSDRVAAPVCAWPCRAIGQGDGWCDDPVHQSYNRPVKLPFAASHEKLWREDHVYDLILVIGHNDTPPVQGLGSAVFVHIARPDFSPTQGCVAFEEADLRAILSSDALAIDIRLE